MGDAERTFAADFLRAVGVIHPLTHAAGGDARLKNSSRYFETRGGTAVLTVGGEFVEAP